MIGFTGFLLESIKFSGGNIFEYQLCASNCAKFKEFKKKQGSVFLLSLPLLAKLGLEQPTLVPTTITITHFSCQKQP